MWVLFVIIAVMALAALGFIMGVGWVSWPFLVVGLAGIVWATMMRGAREGATTPTNPPEPSGQPMSSGGTLQDGTGSPQDRDHEGRYQETGEAFPGQATPAPSGSERN